MITPGHARLMARYNTWQNRSIYAAAATLDDAARRADRGAFWSSIHSTLVHLLWGDQIWMSRFDGTPPPKGRNEPASDHDIETWDGLTRARAEFDATIEAWSDRLTDDWLGRDLTWYSGAAGAELSKPRWILVTHFFNHQTHHRGQVHCMLTAAGARPDDTDLMLLPLDSP